MRASASWLAAGLLGGGPAGQLAALAPVYFSQWAIDNCRKPVSISNITSKYFNRFEVCTLVSKPSAGLLCCTRLPIRVAITHTCAFKNCHVGKGVKTHILN